MRPWYRDGFRLLTHPYSFLEESVRSGDPLPASGVFLTALMITTIGWGIVGAGHFSIVSVLLNALLSLLTYPAAVLAIFGVCRLLIRENRLRSIFTVWGYSYVPTALFFIVNIVAHAIIDNPRLSQMFTAPWLSLCLWFVICLMFLWKVLLLAITLRLGGNLDFGRIVMALILLALICGVYWAAVMSFGWVKIPFI